MDRNQYFKEIENLKIKIIDYTLIVGSILGFFSFIASLFSFNTSVFKVSHLLDFIIILSFALIAFYRNKISLRIKSLIIILGLFILIYFDLIKIGVFSDNKILIIALPFFSFLALSKRHTFYIFLFAIIGYFIIAYLYYTGFIHTSVDLNLRSNSINVWIINILLIIIVSLIVIIVINQFNNTFYNLLANLKQKNIEIVQSEQHYHDIFDSSTEAIFIHNLDGSIYDVNKTMLNMYGYEREDLKELNLDNLCKNDKQYNSKIAIEKMSNALKQENSRFDWQAKKKDGTTFWVDVILKKTQIVGKPKILAIIRDIDEKKKTTIQLDKYRNELETLVNERTKALENAQSQLVHTEKMASLGILSSGIAHEINNPLNYIKGGSLGIKTMLDESNCENIEDFNKLLNAINEGVDRASHIVTSLNHFSRNTSSIDEECDINTILDHCLIVLKSQLKSKITVLRNFNSRPLILKGNDGKLHQAFLNVLSNAEYAIPETGTITITTKRIKNEMHVSIQDTGIGIKKELLSKIDNPFYTTREPGQGTGLGLSITYNIIKDHNGTISYESEPDKGTTVTILLPVTT